MFSITVGPRRSERQLLKSLSRFTNQPDNPLHIDDSDSDADNEPLNNNYVGPVPGAIFNDIPVEDANDLHDVAVQDGEEDLVNENNEIIVEPVEGITYYIVIT